MQIKVEMHSGYGDLFTAISNCGARWKSLYPAPRRE